MKRARIPMLLLAVIALPAALGGQTTTGLHPGARIRVEAPAVSDGHATGTFDFADATTLHMTLGNGAALAVPRDAVRTIDVSTGRRSAWKRGMTIGAASGLVLGLGVVLLRPRAEDPLLPELDRAIDVAGTLAVTGGGAALGGIAGALIRRERWEPVPPTGVQWGAAPASGGVAVGVTLRFAGAGLSWRRDGGEDGS